MVLSPKFDAPYNSITTPMKKLLFILLSGILIYGGFSCNENPADDDLNIFTVTDDMTLGKQLDDEILGNPVEFPILNELQYPQAYYHLRRIADSILNSGQVFYNTRFNWT